MHCIAILYWGISLEKLMVFSSRQLLKASLSFWAQLNYWRKCYMCCQQVQDKKHVTDSILHRLATLILLNLLVFTFFPTEAMEEESSRPRKRQRTGPRKRIQAAEARDSARPAPSQLATKLLKDWAWGKISIQYAQELAHKAVADMQPFECNLPDLQFLAGLGTAGRFPNNMHRDVMKYINSPLPKLFPAPKLQLWAGIWKWLPNNVATNPTEASVPFKGDIEKTIALLLPHELFATLYEKYHSKFLELMVPDGPEALKTFWSRMKFHPGFQSHPLLDIPSFEERAIPVNLHGDCVPITGIGKVWAKNLLALHWSSALCKGNSKDICLLTFTDLWMLLDWPLHRLLFCGAGRMLVFDSSWYVQWLEMVACAWYVLILSETSSNFCCCGLDHDFAQVFDKLASTAEGGTMDSVWQILSWSFNCMQAGKWPKRDHLGHLWLSLHHAHFLQPRNNQN